MDAPFLEGVPYLSREEEALAIINEETRADKTNIADIHLKKEDTEMLGFVAKTRHQIMEWIRKNVG